MKFIEKVIFLFALVAVVSLLLRKPTVVVDRIEIPGDSVPYGKTVTKDSIVFKYLKEYDIDTLWIHDTIFEPVDTAAILEEFFKMISYDSITLRNDTSITNWVSLKISQNRLYEITGYSLNNRKQVIIPPNNGIYIGGMVGKQTVAPAISYQYGNRQFGIAYNILLRNFSLEYKQKINL